MQKRKRAAHHDRSALWSNRKTNGCDDEWDDDNMPSAPSMLGRTPIDTQHERKRRHVEHEIGPPMSSMTLGDTISPSIVKDEEMTSGSSYDISPHRVYVHSLEESNDEDDGGPQDMSYWEVNPVVARRLETQARVRQAEKVPTWIQPDPPKDKEKPSSNSLVLWQPSPWAAEPSTGLDRSQDADMMAIEP